MFLYDSNVVDFNFEGVFFEIVWHLNLIKIKI